MKLSCIAAFFVLSASLFLTNAPVWASACDGSPNCRVCGNCSRCAHCSAGGTCGICSGGSSKKFDEMIAEGIRRDKALYSPKPKPKPKPTPKPDPNAFHALLAKRTVIVVPQVGLRKTANDTSARTQMLKHGTVVVVVATQAGHYKVMTLDNKIGYVPKKAVGVIDEMFPIKR